MITDQVFHKDLKGRRVSTCELSKKTAAQTEAVKAEGFDELLYNQVLLCCIPGVLAVMKTSHVAHVLLTCNQYAGTRLLHLEHLPLTINHRNILGDDLRWVKDGSNLSFVRAVGLLVIRSSR